MPANNAMHEAWRGVRVQQGDAHRPVPLRAHAESHAKSGASLTRMSDKLYRTSLGPERYKAVFPPCMDFGRAFSQNPPAFRAGFKPRFFCANLGQLLTTRPLLPSRAKRRRGDVEASFLFGNNMAKFLCSMGPKGYFFVDHDDAPLRASIGAGERHSRASEGVALEPSLCTNKARREFA